MKLYRLKLFLFWALACCSVTFLSAQEQDSLSRRVITDSLPKIAEPVRDPSVDSVLRVHSPRKATIRSAIIPGWGQVYNKKYWKVPIVYGALGTSAGVFIYNLNWYKRFRYAYRVLVTKDSAGFVNVHPDLVPFLDQRFQETLRNNRDEFRRNVDYSALIFALLWGLNIVDASVDAHLKSFDVSPDLSLHFRAGYSDLAGTNGFSLVLSFK